MINEGMCDVNDTVLHLNSYSYLQCFIFRHISWKVFSKFLLSITESHKDNTLRFVWITWIEIPLITYVHILKYVALSSTLTEIDPDTAYVVCISVSLGFRQKPSDTALLSVIALITFNCIVSAPVTNGALVCFVVTVHWWRHRTHYDVTEDYRALRNILTVHLNNGATRADLRGIPKHYVVTAKAVR